MSNNAALVYLKKQDLFASIAIGDGTNDDSLEEGCDSYLYIDTFKFDGEFIQKDGGQLDYNSDTNEYYSNEKITEKAIQDALVFIISEDAIEYKIIKYYNH